MPVSKIEHRLSLDLGHFGGMGVKNLVEKVAGRTDGSTYIHLNCNDAHNPFLWVTARYAINVERLFPFKPLTLQQMGRIWISEGFPTEVIVCLPICQDSSNNRLMLGFVLSPSDGVIRHNMISLEVHFVPMEIETNAHKDKDVEPESDSSGRTQEPLHSHTFSPKNNAAGLSSAEHENPLNGTQLNPFVYSSVPAVPRAGNSLPSGALVNGPGSHLTSEVHCVLNKDSALSNNVPDATWQSEKDTRPKVLPPPSELQSDTHRNTAGPAKLAEEPHMSGQFLMIAKMDVIIGCQFSRCRLGLQNDNERNDPEEEESIRKVEQRKSGQLRDPLFFGCTICNVNFRKERHFHRHMMYHLAGKHNQVKGGDISQAFICEKERESGRLFCDNSLMRLIIIL
ncbi:LOW QUALITY PROTEIN: uncharacterized protein znf644b [Synchiropus picturatus]